LSCRSVTRIVSGTKSPIGPGGENSSPRPSESKNVRRTYLRIMALSEKSGSRSILTNRWTFPSLRVTACRVEKSYFPDKVSSGQNVSFEFRTCAMHFRGPSGKNSKNEYGGDCEGKTTDGNARFAVTPPCLEG